MNRQTRRNSSIIGTALTLAGVAAWGAEPTVHPDRAAFQAELARLSVDTHAQAADVGRVVAGRALAVTHCITLQPQPKLAAARGGRQERS